MKVDDLTERGGRRIQSHFAVLLVAAIGIGGSILIFTMIHGWETDRVRDQLARVAERRTLRLEEKIDQHIQTLYAIRGLFDASREVDREEFYRFVKHPLTHNREVRAFSWVPQVRDSARPAFEKATQSDGFPDFQITELDARGEFVRAKRHEEYLPVHYVAPFRDNAARFGFDLMSDPAVKDAIALARDTAQPVATGPITGVPESRDQAILLVLVPVYEGGDYHRTLEERRESFKGFVLGVYLSHRLVEAAMDSEGVDMEVSDVTDSLDRGLIYRSLPSLSEGAGGTIRPAERLGSLRGYEKALDIASRIWLLRFHPTARFTSSIKTGGEWVVLTGGLLFTALLAIYLASLKDRARKLLASEQAAISRMEEAEEARRKAEHSESKFRRLLESVPEAMVITDEQGMIVLTNRQTERLFGYTGEDLVGKPVEILVPDRLHASYLRQRPKHPANSQARPQRDGRELRGRRRDGTEVPLEISLSPLETQEGASTLAIIQDITGRKRAEESRARYTEELARSNAELQEFAYVVSHDLQEPLRMVSSYVQLLAKRYRGKLDADATDFIAYAVDGAHRMKQLINDLLAYSRVRTHGKALKPVESEKALKQALANLELAIRERKAAVTHDPLPGVMADGTQLVQLFQNLVGNALKFCRETPKIHVTAQRMEEFRVSSLDSQVSSLKFQVPDGHKFETPNSKLETRNVKPETGGPQSAIPNLNSEIGNSQSEIRDPQSETPNPQSAIRNPKSAAWVFSVRDNGIGIPESEREHIFTIFRRLQPQEYPGTGIGLAVCRKIVDRHGGRIWVESGEAGATFFFTMPGQHKGSGEETSP